VKKVTKVVVAALAATALGVGGVILGVHKYHEDDRAIAAFDSENNTLKEASVIGVGQEAAPTQAFELMQDSRYGPTKVPVIKDDLPFGIEVAGPKVNSGKDPSDKVDISQPRAVSMWDNEGNTRQGFSCRTIYVRKQSPTDKLLAETDSPRPDDIIVRLRPETVEVCDTKPELNEYGKYPARVLIQIVPDSNLPATK
jgi:hypothetical protein